MRCQYCKKRLGITKVLRGQNFCSAEHQQLHQAEAATAFERLRASFDDEPPNKLKLEKSEAKPEQAQAKAVTQPPAASTVEESTKNAPEEQATAAVQKKEITAEEPVTSAANENETEASPEIAALLDAVGQSTASASPEAASFLSEGPIRQQQYAAPLPSHAAEPVPFSPHSTLSQVSSILTSGAIVVDVSPAEYRVEDTPGPSDVAWPSVPQGYPPVIVSASATLVLDPNGAEFIPLPMGEPHAGTGPVEPSEALAIEPQLPHPLLPSRSADPRPISTVSAAFTQPPPAPACEPRWEQRQWFRPTPVQLAGILRPREDVVRTALAARPEHLGSLPTAVLFVVTADVAAPPIGLAAQAAEPLLATIGPRSSVYTASTRRMSRALPLATATGLPAIDWTAPLRCEPASRAVTSSWLLIDIDSHLPAAAMVPPLAPIALSTDKVAVECSISTSFPPSLPTAAAVVSPLPFRLLSRPLSSASWSMPLSTSMRPMQREACRLPASISEQQWARSAAYLHPSVPSPWSLVTWSQSLSISIPACNPSNLNRPAPLGMSVNPGRVHGFRPWPPSRGGYRLAVLLPQPSGTAWEQVALWEACLLPPIIQPIRPGPGGTAPPRLATVRVQPASMAVLPAPSSPRGIALGIGPVASGPCPEDIIKMVSIDVAVGAAKAGWKPRAESSTVLPAFSSARQTPALDLAPSNDRIGPDPVPLTRDVAAVQPFSGLKRLAWSMTSDYLAPVQVS